MLCFCIRTGTDRKPDVKIQVQGAAAPAVTGYRVRWDASVCEGRAGEQHQ